jgi:transcriptional regulator with XRE-family HTH domain
MADNPVSIGERLEEARKRKGISIREAAEATKVRGDYLLAMENNSFEINLPEIYKRGFFKIYVNYLRLDAEKFMADFDAVRSATRKTQHRLVPPPQKREQGAAPTGTPTASPSAQQGRVSFGRMDFDSAGEDGEEGEAINPVAHDGGIPFLRPLMVLAGLVLVVFVVYLVVSAVRSPATPQLNPDLAQPAVATTANAVRPITLSASDRVNVRVIQQSDKALIFDGWLNAGETRNFNVAGPVAISYGKGEALTIERDGQKQATGRSGIGKSIVE